MQVKQASSACTARAARPVVVASLRPVAARNVFQSAQKQVVNVSRVVCHAAAMAVADEDKVKLTSSDENEEALKLSAGYHWYETMMILNTSLSDEERDKELARFEAYLNKEECQNINALVRPRTRMAYPIKGEWEGIYVLYTYGAKRQTAKNIQLLLSNPEAGSEGKVMRHLTFFKC